MFSTALLSICALLAYTSLTQAIQIPLSFATPARRGENQMPPDYNPYGDGGELLMPAGFSRNIVPLPVHSHNDYWRDVPLYTALSYGVTSIEADVWLNPRDEKLYVSHDIYSLTRERTFSRLYVEPLADLLARANPEDAESRFFDKTQFYLPDNTVEPRRKWNAYWMGDSTLSTQLVIDIKTHGNRTLQAIDAELAPIKKWLSFYNGSEIVHGAVTVVLTGNGINDDVRSYLATLRYRHFFLDAPLLQLDQEWTGIDGKTYSWNATLSPMASAGFSKSTKWRGDQDIGIVEKARLTHIIEKAHGLGIKTRFWSTPRWPLTTRHRVWQTLYELGSDILDADDLKDISTFF